MQTFHFPGCSCVIAYASAQLDCYPCADKVSGYQQIYQHIHIYIYTIYSMYQDISKYISIYIYIPECTGKKWSRKKVPVPVPEKILGTVTLCFTVVIVVLGQI